MSDGTESSGWLDRLANEAGAVAQKASDSILLWVADRLTEAGMTTVVRDGEGNLLHPTLDPTTGKVVKGGRKAPGTDIHFNA